jgi:hypothetical protein
MTDSGEFKALVRQRMEATGEKYTQAHRALLGAARGALVPSKHLILPRVAARFDSALVQAAGSARDAGDRTACQDAVRCARDVRDLLGGSGP